MNCFNKRMPCLLTMCFAVCFAAGCHEKEHRMEERGRRIRVRAPFASVDVWVPEDDGDDTRVKVKVDD
ncbi:MAG TPA: hypothetical protein VNT79_13505 [Phycisphaerae bacterium]|nr:hypothetical protein [Phycisphaerae bacterium]